MTLLRIVAAPWKMIRNSMLTILTMLDLDSVCGSESVFAAGLRPGAEPEASVTSEPWPGIGRPGARSRVPASERGWPQHGGTGDTCRWGQAHRGLTISSGVIIRAKWKFKPQIRFGHQLYEALTTTSGDPSP